MVYIGCSKMMLYKIISIFFKVGFIMPFHYQKKYFIPLKQCVKKNEFKPRAILLMETFMEIKLL